MNRILQTYVPDAPPLTDIIYNTSLMLLTSHSSFGNPVPLQPNIKEIGGHHILPPKELPKDIKEFLDSAKEGAILFSMGSTLKSTDFAEDKKKAILNVFSKLKQKVLWKFETDLSDKPNNVKIMKWLPQKDVLAHPNIVAFISHVGLLGTLEAVYSGVPILGLPVFWDQVKNIDDAVRKGFALKLSYFELNEDNFNKALEEILNTPKYRINAKRLSRLIHDHPVKQMDEAIFWIEYVIRNDGAYHLRSSAVNLKWYQRYLVDVFIFVSGIVGVVVLVLYKLFCILSASKHTLIECNRHIKKNE
ncbi:unnamed protein product [Acanthoscelides obtectus]|nr:unnamed protein product [Acanthoscelides obtectus]CAK1624749.1 UDP-glucuronosyltransferase 2B4 [Acanthoscelides obtectus]